LYDGGLGIHPPVRACELLGTDLIPPERPKVQLSTEIHPTQITNTPPIIQETTPATIVQEGQPAPFFEQHASQPLVTANVESTQQFSQSGMPAGGFANYDMQQGTGMQSSNTHYTPIVAEQTMRPEKIVEVQPVVHRQVDAPQVHVIEKHMVPSTGSQVLTNMPIIEETVSPQIIEEIQPIVHHNRCASFVEQHVAEHITQPTTMANQAINDPVGQAQQQQGIQGQQQTAGNIPPSTTHARH